jgi:hypothetical protein
MATPISPNGQLDFHYLVSGREHVTQLRANINNPGAAPGGFLLDTAGGGTIGFTAAADMYILLAKTLLAATSSFVQVVLQEYSGGAYVEKDTYTVSVAGTSGASPILGNQATWTYKSPLNHVVKVVILEGTFTLPQHTPMAALTGVLLTFANDLKNPAAGHVGNWFQGREGYPPSRGLFLTVGLNKQLLRKRNLA